MSVRSEKGSAKEPGLRPIGLTPLSPSRKTSSKLTSGQMSPLSRRGMSVDSAAYKRALSSTPPPRETVAGGARSQSTVDTGMNRLAFENIDLLNTPLSSLRSCSEYNKGMPPSRENSEDTPKSKSFFQSLFSWGGRRIKRKRTKFALGTAKKIKYL